MGIPMFFVRTNRCNLRCSWCDSTYTFTGGIEIELGTLVSEVSGSWEDWICFTGGEPLIQAEAEEFVRRVAGLGKRILIETGGSMPIDRYVTIGNTVIDMDVKTPSSGEQDSIHLQNLELLRDGDYLKFVIKDQADYEFAREFITRHPGIRNLLLQPCFGTNVRWLVESVIRDRLKARVQGQFHKEIWGEMRGV